jgi:L-amino acid N-acyltransferase YncA
MVERVTVGPMTAEDWPAVRRIYAEGIATRQATFETEVPDWEGWDSAHLSEPRLVARDGDEVVGWAALSPVSDRPAYRGLAEVSVYVHDATRGRGVGHRLLEALIQESEEHRLWTLQAAVFPENGASVALHRRCGFREVGRRERIAQHHGVWRDTVLLERRSPRIG